MPNHVCAELVPIFNHLDHESLVKISGITRHRNFRRGETVFSPDRQSGLIIISRGRVKVYQLSGSGKEQLLRVLESGDFFGAESLFGSENPAGFGEALSALEVCTIGREDFMNLLAQYPSISIKLLEEYNRRLVAADRLITSTATESVASRLAGYLLDLMKVAESNEVTLPLPMKELAAFLGTAPETLSRKIGKFEEEGLLERNGKRIRILQPNTLNDIE